MKELLDRVRVLVPAVVAEHLVDEQPLENQAYLDLEIEGKTDEWLMANGYEPIDKQFKLFWRKKK